MVINSANSGPLVTALLGEMGFKQRNLKMGFKVMPLVMMKV